jgi:hypothetical protein
LGGRCATAAAAAERTAAAELSAAAIDTISVVEATAAATAGVDAAGRYARGVVGGHGCTSMITLGARCVVAAHLPHRATVGVHSVPSTDMGFVIDVG